MEAASLFINSARYRIKIPGFEAIYYHAFYHVDYALVMNTFCQMARVFVSGPAIGSP
jgi:hypothetical protein